MALSKFELRRVEKLASEYVKAHRPPVRVRSELVAVMRSLSKLAEP
jgi:hypothetical protein